MLHKMILFGLLKKRYSMLKLKRMLSDIGKQKERRLTAFAHGRLYPIDGRFKTNICYTLSMLNTRVPIRGLLFDLDGTLVDTIGDITAAVNCALATISVPEVSKETVLQFVGHGLTNTLKNLLKHLEIECNQECLAHLNTQLRHCYQAQPTKLTTIYAGIEELLEQARVARLAVGILTNKDQLLVDLIQAKLFPETPFTLVRGAQRTRALKPDPNGAHDFATLANLSPTEVLFVGDSTVDAETAQRAEMQFALAAWGYGPFPKDNSTSTYVTPYALLEEVFS